MLTHTNPTQSYNSDWNL